MMIAIVDYGLGNVGSVKAAFDFLGVESMRTNRAEMVGRADKVVIPGVGSFDNALERLEEVPGLTEAIVAHGNTYEKPILGICLGAQLLLEYSEEGTRRGLGFIPGRSKMMSPRPNLPIPHIGWSSVLNQSNSRILGREESSQEYYFAHSFYPLPDNPEHILATSRYGIDFPSAIGTGNVVGVQFHPEKSHRYGLSLLERFASL